MTVDRDEQVIAAYAAGDDVGHIEQRFGISGDEIHRIVAMGTGGPSAASQNLRSAERPRLRPLIAAGILLMALGIVGPLAAGILWLAVYYFSEAAYPVSSWQGGNVLVGLSGICAGSVLTVTGLVLLVAARTQRQ
ncbi:cell division protein CrgA [Micromonospora halotolerans]|uniref:Cell division protein CrgA n=1 Tax=Micromonospora halotolerans TaxID=709879 RepID=A0ABY9ZW44_9ACTN|nr:cell division protein CrgA [Micromonospora halotolerans]WNM39410.1 cell division protein CrgA [Micromonospora halotolerans]